MARTTIQLGHLTFLDGADRGGYGWFFRELTDWWGGTANRQRPVARPQRHGAFTRARATRAEKVVSFEALYRGRSASEVERAFDELSAVGAETPVLMTVSTDDGPTWRSVIVEDTSARSTHNRPRGWQTVDVSSDDPRRYRTGTPVTTGPPSPGQGLVFPAKFPAIWPGGGSTGRVTLPNEGRAPSAVSLILAGGFSSALITCVETGARVGIARPVAAGQSVVIENGRATLNGQDISRWLRFREWTEVPGLLSRTFQLEASDPVGQPTLTGRVDHAWW
ncbi:hypothetical protein [Microbacterium testaceum]|uniref:hypothetical protein n=1 Tax=Microbacterium testaceum TaxID=2033 RepID=UPI0024352979|nr:hypothetical protein [Microbacterium testaceum]